MTLIQLSNLFCLNDYSCLMIPSPLIGEGNGNPLQYSCLENPMGRGAWWAVVRGVVKSWTRLRDFTFTFHFHALEKEMAAHSSILAWRIPGTAKPCGLSSKGSHRVGHRLKRLSSSSSSLLMDYKFFKDTSPYFLIPPYQQYLLICSTQTKVLIKSWP